MSQTPTTPLSPTPLSTSLFNVFMNNSASASTSLLQQDGFKEEISTIFVVGFPEDMQEREFQNMFMFSPGFEAATLKVPSKDGEEDFMLNSGSSNGSNGRKQIVKFCVYTSSKICLTCFPFACFRSDLQNFVIARRLWMLETF